MPKIEAIKHLGFIALDLSRWTGAKAGVIKGADRVMFHKETSRLLYACVEA
jgi:hypothetical protein